MPPASTPHRIHTGRGGAGNTIVNPSRTTVPPPNTILPCRPSVSSSSSSSTKSHTIHTGRGGAGNKSSAANLPRIPSQARLFSFDEELAGQLEAKGRVAPVYHVGRGGWANVRREVGEVVIEGRRERRRGDDEEEEDSRSGRSESGSENGSEKSGGSAPRAILRRVVRKMGSS